MMTEKFYSLNGCHNKYNKHANKQKHTYDGDHDDELLFFVPIMLP